MSTKSLARKGEKASDSPTDRSVTSDPPPRMKISCRSRIWNLPLPLSPPAIETPQEESDISPFPEHGQKKAKDSKQFASLFYSFSPSSSLLPDPRPISVKWENPNDLTQEKRKFFFLQMVIKLESRVEKVREKDRYFGGWLENADSS